MIIREMEMEDIAACALIEAKNSLTPWNENGLFSYFLREDVRFFVAEDAHEIAGLCALLLIPDEAEILLLTVEENKRRRGVGRALLETQIECAEQEGIRRFFLEVRESNAAAQALYEQAGFHCVGRRKDYYDRPREDALTMAKEI